ncbi:hypothetical protein ACD631_19550 [Alteromonas macleodii]|uniref:hypothetical protein n=1 Tax=Alteromonas macleodii TaxID=28108 RepID=UPI002076ACFD|nr:hypothetical protein [Alteromonas macleodii]USI28534.1 hypothetical protein NFG60_02240 [Alteromonas macleodii]
MNTKITGVFFLLSPFLTWGILEAFDLEFVWFLNENYKYYDLLISFVNFFLMSLGLWILARKHKLTLVISLGIFFIFKHVVFWDLYGNRYLSKVNIKPNVDVALIIYDFGGLASSNAMVLDKFERRLFLFTKRKTLRHYSGIKNAKVRSSGDSIIVEIQHYDNTEVSESIEISGNKEF